MPNQPLYGSSSSAVGDVPVRKRTLWPWYSKLLVPPLSTFNPVPGLPPLPVVCCQ